MWVEDIIELVFGIVIGDYELIDNQDGIYMLQGFGDVDYFIIFLGVGEIFGFVNEVGDLVNLLLVIMLDGGGDMVVLFVLENIIVVMDVDVIDLDGMLNGLIYFIFGGDDVDFFDIDLVIGELIFKEVFNFEEMDNFKKDVDKDCVFEVQVQVFDGNGGIDI